MAREQLNVNRGRTRRPAGTWERARVSGLSFLTGFGVFTPIFLLVMLIGGREIVISRRTTVRPDLLLFLYPLGAAVAGAIFGALEPRARGRGSAALVGMVAIAPWMIAISLAINHGYREWTAVHTFVASVLTVVFGAGMGQTLRDESQRRFRE